MVDPVRADPIMESAASGVTYYTIRHEWAADIAALEQASYPTADPSDLYDQHGIELLAADFAEGCFAGFADDRLVAMGVGVRTPFDFDNPQHSVSDIVPDHGDTSGDTPDGDWYYGTGIAVSNDYRRRGIGNELYVLRKGVCAALNLRGIIAGGVIPGYADHINDMSAAEYIEKVKAGELTDPTLTFQLANGFEARGALANYIEDPAVGSWASLIVWPNPDFDESKFNKGATAE